MIYSNRRPTQVCLEWVCHHVLKGSKFFLSGAIAEWVRSYAEVNALSLSN